MLTIKYCVEEDLKIGNCNAVSAINQIYYII